MNLKKHLWEQDKKYRNILLALTFAMFALCAILAIYKSEYFLLGDINKLNNDDVRYLNTARILANEGRFIYYGNEPTVFIMPLFPLFLSGIMKIFGTGSNGLIAIQITQGLFQCISLYFVYFIAKELFNKKVALYSALITFFYLPEYSASNLILTEVFYKFLFIIMFYFAIIAIKNNNLYYYIITSIFWALSCLVRPNAAPFPLFIIILWIVYKYSMKDMIKYTSIAFVIFVSIFSPWWIRNYKITGDFVLFTKSSGSPKLIGTKTWGGKLPTFAKDIPAEYGHDKRVKGEYLSDEQQDKLANYIIKRGFKEEPLKYGSWYTIGKTINLYSLPYYWREVFGVKKSVMKVIHLILILFSLCGIFSLCKKNNRTTGSKMLLSLLAISTVICWPFVTFARYGYPNMFMIIIICAYLIDKIINRFSTTNLNLLNNLN